MHVYFRPTSLFNTLVMLILLVGGLALIARSIRPASSIIRPIGRLLSMAAKRLSSTAAHFSTASAFHDVEKARLVTALGLTCRARCASSWARCGRVKNFQASKYWR